jgi:hypothetical protein
MDMLDATSSFVHRLADPDARSEVDDRVDAVERSPHGVLVPYVPEHELRVRAQVSRGLGVAVHLSHERIQHAHVVAVLEQLVDQVRPDESRSTGHENGGHMPLSQL